MSRNLNSEVLVFKIADQFFAIETSTIREIIEKTETYQLPLDSQHIKEIFVHRNDVIGILTSDYYFDMDNQEKNFLIILKDHIAIYADSIGSIIHTSELEKGKSDFTPKFIKDIFNLGDKTVFLINYEEVLNNEGSTIILPI